MSSSTKERITRILNECIVKEEPSPVKRKEVKRKTTIHTPKEKEGPFTLILCPSSAVVYSQKTRTAYDISGLCSRIEVDGSISSYDFIDIETFIKYLKIGSPVVATRVKNEYEIVIGGVKMPASVEITAPHSLFDIGEKIAEIPSIKDLAVFASQYKLKPVFNTVCLTESKILGTVLAATDSRRLSAMKFTGYRDEKAPAQLLIPLECKVAKSPIVVYSFPSDVFVFEFDNVKMISSIYGQFPEIDQGLKVIKEKPTFSIFNSESLVSAMDNAVTVGKAPAFRATFNSVGVISAKEVEVGNYVYSGGTPFNFAVNAKYMKEALAFTNPTSVSMYGPMTPIVMNCPNADRFAVIMPIQIKEEE